MINPILFSKMQHHKTWDMDQKTKDMGHRSVREWTYLESGVSTHQHANKHLMKKIYSFNKNKSKAKGNFQVKPKPGAKGKPKVEQKTKLISRSRITSTITSRIRLRTRTIKRKWTE